MSGQRIKGEFLKSLAGRIFIGSLDGIEIQYQNHFYISTIQISLEMDSFITFLVLFIKIFITSLFRKKNKYKMSSIILNLKKKITMERRSDEENVLQ